MVIGAEAPYGSGTTTSTDAAGHYSIVVTLADEPRVVATFSKGDDWSVQRRGAAVPDGNVVDGLDGQLQHLGSVSGRLTSSTASVDKVFVTLRNRFNGRRYTDFLDSDHTDAQGRFRFEGVPSGRYALDIDVDDHLKVPLGGVSAPRAEGFDLLPDQDLTVGYDLVAAPETRGQVAVDYSGPAIYRQSLLRAYRLGSPRVAQLSGIDPERQPTVLSHLPAGRYKLALDEFTWYGGASRSSAAVVTVTAGATTAVKAWANDAEAENSVRAFVRGGFVTEDGAHIDDLTIELLRRDAPGEVLATTTAERGGFEFFDLAGGDYLVRASDATGRYRSRTVDVSENPSEYESYVLPSVIPLGPAFAGPATASASMVGRNGPICLFPTNGRTAEGDLVCGEYDSASQRYQITGIKPGTYRVRLGRAYDWNGNQVNRFAPWVGGRSEASATVFTFAPGEYKELAAIKPSTRGELVGTAVDESGQPVDDLTFFAYAADNPDEVVETAPGGEFWHFWSMEVRPYKIKVVDATGRYEPTWVGGDDFASATAATPPISGTRELPPVVMNKRPSALASPALSGSAQLGSALTATTGVWRDEDLSFAYQWLRDGVPIPDATAAAYRVTSGDVGHDIAARVVATDASGDRAGTTSGTVTAIDEPLRTPPMVTPLPATPLPDPKPRLASKVRTTVTALGGQRVRVTLRLSAPGLIPTGRVLLRSGGSTVMSWRTLKMVDCPSR
jgi:hypothetical protein